MVVVDANKLGKEVMPHFFKHSNFNSFVRQLNMYGFHKVHISRPTLSSDGDEWEFVHPCVQRGRPDLLKHIKRKEDNKAKKNVASSDMTNVLGALGMLKQEHDALLKQFETLQGQNGTLWEVLSAERKRHDTQQQKIEKIMGYLGALYNGQSAVEDGPPSKRAKLSIEGSNEPFPSLPDSAPASAQIPPLPTGATEAPHITEHVERLEQSFGRVLDDAQSKLDGQLDEGFLAGIFQETRKDALQRYTMTQARLRAGAHASGGMAETLRQQRLTTTIDHALLKVAALQKK